MNGSKHNRMKRNLLTAGLAIALAAGLAAGAQLYATNAQQSTEEAKQQGLELAQREKRLAQVKIWRVFPLPMDDILNLPGTLKAYEDVDLAAKASGAVEWLGAEEGDAVKAGDKLLRLDVDTLQAEVDREKASVDLAQANFDRVKNLYEKNVASKEEYDSNQTALKTAQAALEESQARLDDATLVSPIDGFLDRRFVDRGEYVSPGQEVFKIVDISRIKAMANVPEKDALYFKKGQQALVIIDNNGNSRQMEGTIEWVALTADPMTRTYPVKIVLDNPDLTLRPGLIVTVRLVRRELQDAIAVPFFSIDDTEESKSVFVLREDGTVAERPIQYGFFQDGLVQITKGLQAGDALVVVGQRDLVNGQEVEVAEDLTPLARQFINGGGDLSRLAMEYQ